jgi:ferredoxin
MIIAEWKPIPELVAKLQGHPKILLVGCATCVAECAAGGEKEVETLAPLLRMALQADGHPAEVITRTLERQCEWEFVEELKELIPRVDAVLSLACGIGIQAVAERYSEIQVYPGVNTTALAIREEPGLWLARCQACGDCVLGETFGLCPVARCAKSLQNGPCGGTRKDGKCEVDENLECVWYQIVKRAEARGQLEKLLEFKPAKNWSNSLHGGPKRVLREDLRP